jgi:hypothetical protein
MHKVLAATLLAIAATSSLAADDKTPPTMAYITEWEGPFKETRIVKFADYSDGVACYVFIPMNIATSLNCSGRKCGTQFKDSIGSISCVKVIDNKPATPTTPSNAR